MFGNPVRNEMDWKKIKLESVCEVCSSKRVFVEELVEKGIPFYRGTEIGQLSEGKKIMPRLFITKEHYEKLKKDTGIPKIGDLLLPSICPDGRIYEVPHDAPFYFKDGRVLWIKVDRAAIDSVYLKKLLKAIFYIDYSKIASGTTFAELKIFALKKIEILLPPISLQNRFGIITQNIQLQMEQLKQQADESDNLFQSLLQRAFKGDLV
jgi:type I restriction enzyme S subunit